MKYDSLEEMRDALAALQPAGRCDQCASATINGVYCHETGCPVAAEIKKLKSAIERAEDEPDEIDFAPEDEFDPPEIAYCGGGFGPAPCPDCYAGEGPGADAEPCAVAECNNFGTVDPEDGRGLVCPGHVGEATLDAPAPLRDSPDPDEWGGH